jgi:hypothetical protein
VASFVEELPRALEEYARLNPVPGSEPFIASLSSSSAELIRVGKVFCPRMKGELLKQYALACVAFLTGGGHHSFHEVMQVAALGSLPYSRGGYDFVLPESFKDTGWYDLLIEDYPDVLFTEYDSTISAYRRLDNVWAVLRLKFDNFEESLKRATNATKPAKATRDDIARVIEFDDHGPVLSDHFRKVEVKPPISTTGEKKSAFIKSAAVATLNDFGR